MTGWQRVIQVPDTWEGWAVRILTIMLTLVLVSAYLLLDAIDDLQAYLAESRVQRATYQQAEAARECAILLLLSSASETERLGC